MLSILDLNSSMLLESITRDGRFYQITIVDGKKECRKALVWHETVLSRCECPLIQLLLGVVYLSADIATKLLKILHSIIALDIHLLCSSVGHPNCYSIPYSTKGSRDKTFAVFP